MTRRTDFLAGLFFVAVGLAFMIAAIRYNLGSASRMGPGYFPLLLAGLLIFIGIIVGLRGILKPDAEPSPELAAIDPKSLTAILGGTVLFGVTLTYLGLIAAIFVLVLVSSAAVGRSFHWQTFVLAAALAAFSACLFVFLLGLPIPLWPAG